MSTFEQFITALVIFPSSLLMLYNSESGQAIDLLMCIESPKMKIPGFLFCSVSKTMSVKCKQKRKKSDRTEEAMDT